MFSQTTEYGLRAAACLARYYEVGPLTTEQIADVTQTPTPYLAKVLLALAREGLVESRRGIHGGHRLRRKPKDITLLDVVNAVEPIQRIHECPLHLPEHSSHLCPVHERLDRAIACVLDFLASSTLDDIVKEEPSRPPLCTLAPVHVERSRRVSARTKSAGAKDGKQGQRRSTGR